MFRSEGVRNRVEVTDTANPNSRWVSTMLYDAQEHLAGNCDWETSYGALCEQKISAPVIETPLAHGSSKRRALSGVCKRFHCIIIWSTLILLAFESFWGAHLSSEVFDRHFKSFLKRLDRFGYLSTFQVHREQVPDVNSAWRWSSIIPSTCRRLLVTFTLK